jgi:Uma2 family endonuclease
VQKNAAREVHVNDGIDAAVGISSEESGNMQAEVQTRRFTSDEFYRMAEAGIFGPDERVELIEGEIVEMSPMGDRHLMCVNQATELFVLAFAGKAKVSVQNAVRLNIQNVPQPDLVLYKPRAEYRSTTRPNAKNCFLVVEVSDSSLRYDTKVKVPIYAKTGISEVWIEDLRNDLLLVYRNPSGEAYATELTFKADDSVSLLAFPDTSFPVRDLLLAGLPIVD